MMVSVSTLQKVARREEGGVSFIRWVGTFGGEVEAACREEQVSLRRLGGARNIVRPIAPKPAFCDSDNSFEQRGLRRC